MKTGAIANAQIDALAEFLRTYAGLAFAANRRFDLVTGLQKVMTGAGIADAEEFIGRLATDPKVLDALVAQVTVGETYFFREPEQLDWLRRKILPVLSQNRPPNAKLRFWSAGCASGEEPYTLAILLDQEGLGEQALVMGTDISRPALVRARQANFGAWSMRATSPEAVERYFRRQGDRYLLDERLRERVAFAPLNLFDDTYPSYATDTSELDVIFCRNVLIYLDQDAAKQIAMKLLRALRVGGWLITGPSDPPLWGYAPFETVVTPAGVLYRRGHGAAVPAREVWSPVVNDRGGGEHWTDGAAITPPRAVVAEAVSPISPPPTPPSDGEACAGRVRTLADRGDLHGAEREATAAIRAHALDAELYYLHAIILLGLGRDDEAVGSLRRVLYLDRSLAAAHFTLATVMRRQGALVEARRGYRSALALCNERPPDEIVPLSDGECCGRLAAAARAHLALIDLQGEAVS